ncbi:MAG: T9SS type A sorting domain-containing protein [Saprospiraceae bacterium]|nr:T9SS type A sorting domain-containing protein [Saprospiraceae bacterium]
MVAASGASFCTDIKVSHFKEVIGIQWFISWNPAVIQFDSLAIPVATRPFLASTNFGTLNTAEGELRHVWNSNSLASLTLPDSSSYVTLCFTAVPTRIDASTSLKVFVSEVIQFPEQVSNLQTVYGEVKVIGDSSVGNTDLNRNLIFNIDSATLPRGENGRLLIRVDSLIHIDKLFFDIHWNPNVIRVNGSPDGYRHFSWVSNDGLFLENGSVISPLFFQAIGRQSSSTNVTITNFYATSTDGDTIAWRTNGGMVNISENLSPLNELALPRQGDEASENTLLDKIVLFPNPASERIFIQHEGNVEISKAVLLNGAGKRLETFLEPTAFSTTKLVPGDYFLLLTTNEGVISKRFTVQR